MVRRAGPLPASLTSRPGFGNRKKRAEHGARARPGATGAAEASDPGGVGWRVRGAREGGRKGQPKRAEVGKRHYWVSLVDPPRKAHLSGGKGKSGVNFLAQLTLRTVFVLFKSEPFEPDASEQLNRKDRTNTLARSSATRVSSGGFGGRR